MEKDIVMEKYFKLTEEELNSLVRIIARLFVGNNLVAYVVNTNNTFLGYMPCEMYDEIRNYFKAPMTTITDKSNIRRITFKTNPYFSADRLKYCKMHTFEVSEASIKDADIFGGTTFIYKREEAIETKNIVMKTIEDYCKNKYAKEIEEERACEHQRQFYEFKKLLEEKPFIEVYDTYLKEVVAYVCVDKSSMVMMCIDASSMEKAYNPQLVITARDLEKIEISLNVVDKVELEPSINVYRNKKCSIITRKYGVVNCGGDAIYIKIMQDLSGVVSTMPRKFYIDFDVDEKSREFESLPELLDTIEKLRLQGNKWFHNNGKTFLPESKVVKTSNANKSIMTLFKR